MKKLLGSLFGSPVVVDTELKYHAGDTVWVRGYAFSGLKQAKVVQAVKPDIYIIYEVENNVMKAVSDALVGKQCYEVSENAIVAKVEVSNETSNS